MRYKFLNNHQKCIAAGYFNSTEINLISISWELYEGELRFNQNRSFKEFRFFLAT